MRRMAADVAEAGHRERSGMLRRLITTIAAATGWAGMMSRAIRIRLRRADAEGAAARAAAGDAAQAVAGPAADAGRVAQPVDPTAAATGDHTAQALARAFANDWPAALTGLTRTSATAASISVTAGYSTKTNIGARAITNARRLGAGPISTAIALPRDLRAAAVAKRAAVADLATAFRRLKSTSSARRWC